MDREHVFHTSFAGFDGDGFAVRADVDPVKGGHLDFVVFPCNEIFDQVVSLILWTLRRTATYVAGKYMKENNGDIIISLCSKPRRPK